MKVNTQHSIRMLTLAVVSSAFIGLTGCATTAQFEELQTKINTVASDASSAKADATAANSKASEALRIADEANKRSLATEERLGRAFNKSMYK